MIAYLIGVAVLIGMTLVEHEPPQPANTAGEGRPEFRSTYFWYDRLVGTPDPRDRHVAIITIGKDMPGDFPHGGLEVNTKSAEAGRKRAQTSRKGADVITRSAEARTILPPMNAKVAICS